MDIPFIQSSENGYSLEFKIPLIELENAKKGLEELTTEGFENFAKLVYNTYTKPHLSYPRLKWDDKQLVGIQIGNNCACVGSSISGDKRTYYFHNVDFSWQAIFALQILAEYVNDIKRHAQNPSP